MLKVGRAKSPVSPHLDLGRGKRCISGADASAHHLYETGTLPGRTDWIRYFLGRAQLTAERYNGQILGGAGSPLAFPSVKNTK